MLFFFDDPPTTEIYTLSLHDALPISRRTALRSSRKNRASCHCPTAATYSIAGDRKSTRLNSSHRTISYAVFCLKKKRKNDRCNHLNAMKKTTTSSINRQTIKI